MWTPLLKERAGETYYDKGSVEHVGGKIYKVKMKLNLSNDGRDRLKLNSDLASVDLKNVSYGVGEIVFNCDNNKMNVLTDKYFSSKGALVFDNNRKFPVMEVKNGEPLFTLLSGICTALGHGDVRKDAVVKKEDCKAEGESLVEKIKLYYSTASNQQDGLIDVKLLASILNDIDIISSNIYGQWQVNMAKGVVGKYDAEFCRIRVEELTPEVINVKLNLSGIFIKFGLIKEARSLLRSIVTDYTGNAYRGYVRKAEFMLEDLKESR
jgi:hypothetical protein